MDQHNEQHEHDGKRPHLEGVEVREEDLEPQRGLHLIAIIIRVAAVVIFLLAVVQFVFWWRDRPPGNVGMGVLVGDTIRLVVYSALLWAAAAFANLMIKTHYDVRAGRILLARQTYMMKQMGIAEGAIPIIEEEIDRRGLEPEETVDPGSAHS